MKISKISILGAGNLGLAIAEGLLKSGTINKNSLILTEKLSKRITELKEIGFNVVDDNIEAVKKSELIIVAVKPKQIVEVVEEIKDALDPLNQIVASCVTGISSIQIFNTLGYNIPLFRVMPNTGMSIQESMSCISAFYTSKEQEKEIERIFSELGQVLFIPEELMGAATVLAGCGIAFALRFIRAATQGGIEIGLKANDAQKIAAQIAKGAAELILSTGNNPEIEIDKVTTPGGITIKGLNEMENNGFSSSIIEGMIAAFEKVSGK